MKPKRLVIVRPRQDRGKWEVDHPNPSPTGPRRCRPLFATEVDATAYAAMITKQLSDGMPVVADRDIVLSDYAPKFWPLAKAS